MNKLIRYLIENKFIPAAILILLIGAGIAMAPFDWDTGPIPRDPVPVDAIPNYGENQQVVFTDWPGRSPQDVEDQITYPLTTELLGLPGVKTVRGQSMFGFSSIYVILEDGVDFYWSRSRILEALNALPDGELPEGVQPTLGPDATALGQIFWYTIEGRDKEGNPTGGWDLHEIRSIQDYYVRYALNSVEGVAEVASVGGYEKEYQVELNPSAMVAHGVTIPEVAQSIRRSNIDVGARTLEMNKAEYLVRGLGYIQNLDDIRNIVIQSDNHIPITVGDIAKVTTGPAERRGALDKDGVEVAGGVVTAREGENPMEVINNVNEALGDVNQGLPSKTLADGTESQLKIVPFYDRTELIQETIGTLEEAITLQILISVLVIVVIVANLRASLFISSMLPLSVLIVFIMMKYVGVEANIVALSGIAIAIGTMIDMGVILSENMLRHLEKAAPEEPRLEVIYKATTEVSSAVLTAGLTTIISFLPVFTLTGAEGKLFTPLAYTKTFALVAALLVSLLIIPPLAHALFARENLRKNLQLAINLALGLGGLLIAVFILPWAGIVLMAFSVNNLASPYWPGHLKHIPGYITIGITVMTVAWLLGINWLPLGPEQPISINTLFILLIVAILLTIFISFIRYFTDILRVALQYKAIFLVIPVLLILFGLTVWQGFDRMFGFIADGSEKTGIELRETSFWGKAEKAMPGIGQEFMPDLDEGSFLLMPTVMPHAGIEESKKILQWMDKQTTAIPEVETSIGKIGRAETPLDPAPVSMFENIIHYKNEYKTDEHGRKIRFKVDQDGQFVYDENEELIKDSRGQYFRQWRDHIESPDDIWDEITDVLKFPGLTSAPKLQPIETRIIMLQTGMRAPIGIRIEGPDLATIDTFALNLEEHIQDAEGVRSETVFADRVVGKPYLELDIDRNKIARYGLNIEDVQNYIQIAVGGMPLTTTVEQRERYEVRARYPREYRNSPEKIGDILIPDNNGNQIPLRQVADINYERGPQMIRTENSFLSAYVIFDGLDGYSEVDVVENTQDHLNNLIDSGDLNVPSGVTYEFTGEYQHHVRAQERLSIVIPLSLFIILFILYLQFRSLLISLMIFSAIFVAFAGGFILLWLYGVGSFMDFSVLGKNMRELFQMETVFLSVAVWVGFLNLFGLATDNGVVLTTYINQVFDRDKPQSKEEIHNAILEAGEMRVRPCLITSATTILALLPVLSSTGRGADVMIPMAIPAFGGMLVVLVSLFMIPVLYSMWQEYKLKKNE